jgi:hypothetical protein
MPNLSELILNLFRSEGLELNLGSSRTEGLELNLGSSRTNHNYFACRSYWTQPLGAFSNRIPERSSWKYSDNSVWKLLHDTLTLTECEKLRLHSGTIEAALMSGHSLGTHCAHFCKCTFVAVAALLLDMDIMTGTWSDHFTYYPSVL